MNVDRMNETAQALVADGKGLLAADESTNTIKKRLDQVNVESTEATRRDYRHLLFTTPGVGRYISGVILYDETIRQDGPEGVPLIRQIEQARMIPGIKVDRGAKPLAPSGTEKVTEGLDGLRERLADVPGDIGEAADFAGLQGALPWPVDGDIVAAFGSDRGGGLRRTGIVVEADRGDEVSAVAPGRVVFSDWLRGRGLLVIIEHGDGYLTLYGHSEALYVDVGEWVQAGQAIATVGSSGNRAEPGLYFEVRQGAEPQDPTAWLR